MLKHRLQCAGFDSNIHKENFKIKQGLHINNVLLVIKYVTKQIKISTNNQNIS